MALPGCPPVERIRGLASVRVVALGDEAIREVRASAFEVT